MSALELSLITRQFAILLNSGLSVEQALNALIDEISADSVGNIDYKSITINWDEYQNKLILINGKELTIFNITRVF